MTNPCIDSSLAPFILVDAYSTGALLARALAGERRLLHVRSRAQMPAAFAASCPTELFVADYSVADESLEALIARLAAHQPAAVLTGSEFGVELADLLAARLGLPGNDPATSAARRDKSLMAEQVAQAGLPVAAQLRTRSMAEALAWFKARGGASVVAKPLDSAGSDNVFICHDALELQAAVETILGSTNLMMLDNQALLLQEYLSGDEYVINSVSHEGEHWITDVWKSSKTFAADGRKIYDCEDLLPADASQLPQLIEYVQGVLDALGIVHGPAHTELILTADGPRLLETGARLSGLACPPALQAATGNDQVALTCLSYLTPAHLVQWPKRYRLLQHARCLNLIAHRSGLFAQDQARQRLETLASFHNVRFRHAEGAAITPTIDLNSSPGAVFLLHPLSARIEADHAAWRGWERDWL
ncbi:ATP-grasp domain-containing protein [Pseudomonas sp. SWRI111]|uniref:ATP-grasp domain-containing protein n=1 Tax=Pseudomonas sp. SWRI111 TaxID=2745507 RepID=UPI0016463DC3|nr:ATP-grasp domain-containing protein [Pseudomonas sp. SWRI111]MBC3207208.1 ATP-grasp domain-containing protein [Pseudomonas sp. SWRI111]